MNAVTSDIAQAADAPSHGRGEALHRLVRDVILVLGVLATIGLAVVVAVVHVQFMRVGSPSMEPTIGVGDVVMLRQESAMKLAEGQVVVLPVPDEGGAMYLHRLTSVRVVDGQVVVRTMGDANPAPDPWELRIESATVPLVVGQVPLPGVLARASGIGLTRLLLGLLLALISAPAMMAIMRRMRVGTRLRALPVRLEGRRHR